MSAQVLSFAIAYRIARGTRLLPRTPCSCGCGRTVSETERVCMYRTKVGELRVYARRECLFQHVGGLT